MSRGRPRLVAPIPVPEGHKYCRACERAKPTEAFGNDRARGDGLRFRCRQCDAAYARARSRALNPEWGTRRPGRKSTSQREPSARRLSHSPRQSGLIRQRYLRHLEATPAQPERTTEEQAEHAAALIRDREASMSDLLAVMARRRVPDPAADTGA
jgi:hypothetical protein